MDGTILPHVLSKLDQIREHQIKEGEAMSEIRHLLRSLPAQSAAPATMLGVASSRLEGWLLSAKPWAIGAAMLARHAVAVATIAWMVKSGQEDKALVYINWLLGL